MRRPPMNEKFNAWTDMKKNDLVWYACYGSNLCADRFMRYIERCADHTPPRDSKPVIIPHKLYFAKASAKWENKAVAFVEPLPAEGVRTLGRAYLISKEQFADIQLMECGQSKKGWYRHELKLGVIGKYPISCFTSPGILAANNPSEKYLDVIRKGLRETWPELGREAHEKYLADLLNG